VECRYQGLDLMYSKWDMAIFVQLDRGPDGKETLDLTLDYPARLFDQSTIDNLILKLRDSAIEVIDHAENPVLEPSSDIDLSDPSVRLEVVRSAWQEVLGFTEIDDDTGFFDAGGDSLLLVALVEQLSKASGRMLNTMEVFRAGCIQNQAALLA
jgi:aryl carrier-like protein